MDPQTLRDRLLAAQAKAGMKPQQVIDDAKVGEQQYYKWLRAESGNPGVFDLAKVARTLNVSMDWLCGLSEQTQIVPYGQILLNQPVVEAVLKAKDKSEIDHLRLQGRPIDYGYEVSPETTMPPRAEAEKIVREFNDQIDRLYFGKPSWFSRRKKEKGSGDAEARD